MLGSFTEYVGFPSVVALVLGGIAILVWAATLGGRLGQLVAGFVGVLVVLGGLVLMFFVWLKRMNADIGGNRHDIERDLDDILDERESEK
ncbi:hypothetical protein ACFR9U_02150 [Halorientalis brevis]|uniref:Uncharacterized protein n=1 Tax=Halorientalis brevis TaxID=1126241 RepID=A0ABD6C6I1_9EURY|nr:hypothetical protein [Halorientalis brevis]